MKGRNKNMEIRGITGFKEGLEKIKCYDACFTNHYEGFDSTGCLGRFATREEAEQTIQEAKANDIWNEREFHIEEHSLLEWYDTHIKYEVKGPMRRQIEDECRKEYNERLEQEKEKLRKEIQDFFQKLGFTNN